MPKKVAERNGGKHGQRFANYVVEDSGIITSRFDLNAVVIRLLMDDLTLKVWTGMKAAKMTSRELAERIGIHEVTMSNKLNNKSDFSLQEIMRIEKVLKIQILEVVK